jgi:hypothetical protein
MCSVAPLQPAAPTSSLVSADSRRASRSSQSKCCNVWCNGTAATAAPTNSCLPQATSGSWQRTTDHRRPLQMPSVQMWHQRCPRADGSSRSQRHRFDWISSEREPNLPAPTHCALETRSMHVAATALHDRMPKRTTGGGCNGRRAVATDDGQLQRTTGGGRRAADDAQQIPRGSDAVPARSLRLTACSYRQRRTSHRCGLAGHHLAWMVRCVAHQHHADRDRIGTRVRMAPSSARTLRQRQYQQHAEQRRIFEWPTSAKPGTGRRHATFKFHWARIVRRMRARSRCSEWRILTLLARFPSLPNRRIAAALSCP